MAKLTEASSEVIHIAEDLIQQHHPWLKDANIGFVFQDPAPKSSGRVILGKAQKVPTLMKVFLDYDFIITLSEDEYNTLSTERRVALIDHELCHCIGLPGEWRLRGHDFEEFHAIIQRHGFWTEDLLRIAKDDVAHEMQQLSLFEKAVKNLGKVEAVDVKILQGGRIQVDVETEAPAEVA